MKRYQFNLASVLRARRAQEDVARADLLRAHQSATRAARAVAESRVHYQAAAAASGAEFRAHREMWVLAGQSVVEAETTEDEARAGVVSAMDNYLGARRAVDVLQHLDQAKREEHAAAVQHEEAAAIDELVVTRHARQRAQAAKASPDEDGDDSGAGPEQ